MKKHIIYINYAMDNGDLRRALVCMMNKREVQALMVEVMGVLAPKGDFWHVETDRPLYDTSGFLGELFPKEIPSTLTIESVRVPEVVFKYMENVKPAWALEYIKNVGLFHTLFTPVPSIENIKKMLFMA